MVDLSSEIGELWKALGAPAPGQVRVVQFVAARRGEGTSTIAREFARYAAQRARRRTWLVDMDLKGSHQYAAIAAAPQRFGALGRAVSASPNGSSFVAVNPQQPGLPNAAFLAGHQVGSTPWWVTRFRRELLKGRQKPHVMPGGEYWQALRKHAEIIVVDSPSLDTSQSALSAAPYMDQTVLVLAADERDVRSPVHLRDALSAVGGRPAGIFYNRAQVLAPRFLTAMLP